ncbi:retrovirus-related Pol polyprotein from transposon opus [Trichonephila clavipes]|nr:retrovirus-related Pol polyprotein from transposon opus [Trichonephila clavipes]
MAKKYHSSVKCLICGRRHYVLLCPELRKENPSSSKDKMINGKEHPTEVLLTNLPTERFENNNDQTATQGWRIKAVGKRKETFSQGLFGGGISPAIEHGRYIVTVEGFDRKYSTKMSLLDQQKICSILQKIRDESLLSDLASRGIKLTDVGKDTTPIRVLLGADTLGCILTRRIESIKLPKIWDLEVLGITDPVERKNKILFEEETLTHFKETLREQFNLFTDASGVGIGAVLNQNHRPIAFVSRTLNKAERNYTVTERECLAVIWALNKFKTYFGSLPVKVITDHAALTKLTNGINLSSRMIGGALKLSEFKIEWEHRPGTQNVVADVLSRNPVDNVEGSQISCSALRALAMNSREQLIQEQREDPELGHINYIAIWKIRKMVQLMQLYARVGPRILS